MDGIWLAAREGDLGEIERLVGEDPDQLDAGDGYGWTPLMVAAAEGHVGVVRWLLDKGAAINERDRDGFTALWIAGCHGQSPVVRLLVVVVRRRIG
jgi:ankyrin repeat protein